MRFHKAVELIGRRWSGAIIQILRQRPSRYAELRTAIPDITDRMLSERLRELEDEAIVARTVIPETPVRVEYLPDRQGPGAGAGARCDRPLGRALGRSGRNVHRRRTRGKNGTSQAGRRGRLPAQRRRSSPP